MAKKSLFFTLIVCSVLACGPVLLGLRHNAMGEFCLNGPDKPCDLDWLAVGALWLSWALPLSLIAVVMVAVGQTITRRLRHGPKGL